jgi:hypothetical protein
MAGGVIIATASGGFSLVVCVCIVYCTNSLPFALLITKVVLLNYGGVDGCGCFCGGVDCFLLLFQMTLFGLQIRHLLLLVYLERKKLMSGAKSNRQG